VGTKCVSCEVVSEVWCTIPTNTSSERPCHGSCGQSSTCHGGAPGLIQDQSVWGLWWIKLHWEWVVSSITVSAPLFCSHCYLILLTEGQAGEEHSNTAVLFRMWWNTAEKHFHIGFCCYSLSSTRPCDSTTRSRYYVIFLGSRKFGIQIPGYTARFSCSPPH
jgi:hypothetical protein